MPSRFVGRVSELERCRSAVSLSEAGRAGFVLVTGELGIGKTSFALAAAKSLAGEAGSVYYYSPKRPDSELAPPAQLAPAFDELVSSGNRGDEVVAAVAAAKDRRLVLVFDDLRESSEGVRSLLVDLARARNLGSVVVVGTYHDHLLTSRDPLRLALSAVSAEAEVVHLRLKGLSPDECAAMFAAQTRKRLGLAARRKLAELSDGNPLIVNELAVQYGLSEDASPADFFATHAAEAVMMIFAEPFAALPEAEQAVVIRAALVGTHFGLSELRSAAADDAVSTVVTALEHAQEIGLLVESAEPLHGAAGYSFSHAILPEALLSQLTAARRALLAEEIALRLEEYYGEDTAAHADTLAGLFAAASNSRKATQYGLVAGEHAVRAGDFAKGLAYLDLAAAALGSASKADRARYLMLRGQALLALGELEEAMRFFRQAVAVFGELGDKERILETATYVRQVRPGRSGIAALVNVAEGILGDSSPALELQKVHSAIFESGDFEGADARLSELAGAVANQPYFSVRVRIMQAYLASIRRDYGTVDELLPSRPSEVAATTPMGTLALETISRSLAQRGVVNQVRATLRMAVEAALESRDVPRLQWTSHRLARFLAEHAELDSALAAVETGLEASPSDGFLLRDGALISFLNDDREAGEVYLNELIDVTNPESPADILDASSLVHSILDRNRIFELEDDLDLAGRLAGAILAEAGDLPFYAFRGHAAVIRRGWLVRDQDGVEEAVAALRRLGQYRLCRDHQLHYLLAVGHWLLHDVDASEAEFATAADSARRSKDLVSLGWILLDWAMYRVERGAGLRAAEVRPILSEALSLARDLRVVPLERQVVRFVPVHASRAFTTPTGEMLTPREIEILQILAKGKSNQAIAEHFDISKNTVANHMQRILDKTGSKNRTEAVIFAWENGIARRG